MKSSSKTYNDNKPADLTEGDIQLTNLALDDDEDIGDVLNDLKDDNKDGAKKFEAGMKAVTYAMGALGERALSKMAFNSPFNQIEKLVGGGDAKKGQKIISSI